MYPLFVAIAVVLAAGTHHRVVSAGGMQLKHVANERVHMAQAFGRRFPRPFNK